MFSKSIFEHFPEEDEFPAEEEAATSNGEESDDSVSIDDIEEDPDGTSSEERNYQSMLARRARNQELITEDTEEDANEEPSIDDTEEESDTESDASIPDAARTATDRSF